MLGPHLWGKYPSKNAMESGLFYKLMAFIIINKKLYIYVVFHIVILHTQGDMY